MEEDILQAAVERSKARVTSLSEQLVRMQTPAAARTAAKLVHMPV